MSYECRMKNERRNLSLERAQMRTEDEQISERERSWLGSLTDERGGREEGGRVASQCNAATWDVAITIRLEGGESADKIGEKGRDDRRSEQKGVCHKQPLPAMPSSVFQHVRDAPHRTQEGLLSSDPDAATTQYF